MKLWWAKYRGDEADRDMTQSARANALGYVGSSVRLFRELQKLGVEFTPEAKTWIWYCHPKVYLRDGQERGERNILLTMYEGTPVPPEFPEAFSIVDGILTPSRFCRDLFKPFAKGKPIGLTGLGFDRDVFTFERRNLNPEGPFKFLFCGAPNGRKGFPQVLLAWKWCGFMRSNVFQLTMKTTTEVEEEQVELKNVRFDSSYLSVDELADLYRSHHCLVAPTHGEGWGLISAEALATGMPVISTKYSGVLDFLNEQNCYFTPYKFQFVKQKTDDGREMPFRAAVADHASLGRTMIEVVKNYNVALKKAERGSRFMHARFGWEDVAKRFLETIQKMQGRWSN